ncbi:energy transducer TonB [Altericroceibacterium xinjiangense]|uniref:energy transducer TonB n=1 Tax=Altericroceibacterium xinjiangense TaxID=762261 RepID=UPI001F49546B|nr:energy transducer TonB [Altericroceibacterium xinjiangense]
MSVMQLNIAAAEPHFPPPEAVAVIAPPPVDRRGEEAVSRSYEHGRPRWAVLTVILALHAIGIGTLLTLRFEGEVRQQLESVATFEITEPPAPPMPEPDIPPSVEPVADVAPIPPAPQPVVAPAPEIQLVTRAPQITVAPVALPVETVALALPVAAAPQQAAPAPAPPAPITPPDFKASQLNNPGPSYPYLSRKGREEGVVVLRVLVSVDGRAVKLEMDNSSGHDRLDKAALETVRKWRFVPAKQAGKPREAWVLVPVTFSLG